MAAKNPVFLFPAKHNPRRRTFQLSTYINEEERRAIYHRYSEVLRKRSEEGELDYYSMADFLRDLIFGE